MRPQLTILHIEDDLAERDSMQSYIQSLDDIELVGATSSAYEGIKLLGQLKPDVIILDLELLDGNGIIFLEDMQLMRLSYLPFVFVTTRTRAGVVRDAVEALGAQYFYCKNNPAYSPKTVIGILRSLFKFNDTRIQKEPDFASPMIKTTSECNLLNADAQREKRRSVSLLLAHLSITAGKESNTYLTDAIMQVYMHMLAGKPMPDLKNDIYPVIGEKYGLKPDSVDRNLRYTLENSWMRTHKNTIEKYYPFPIAHDRTCPSPKEFIFNIASAL